MLSLRLVFTAQLLVMLTGFVSFQVTPADFQTVALLFYLVIVGLASVLFALRQFIQHPGRRAWAGAIVATPVVCLTTPFLIVSMNGGAVAPGALVALLVVLIAIAALVLLLQKGPWKAGRVFSGNRFNSGLLVALCALLALYWAPVIAGLYLHDSVKLPTDISERDNALRIGAVYFVTVAGPAFFLSVFALLYAPVGLLRNSGKRLLHTGQLTVALTTLASLAVGVFFVAVSMVNPG